MKLLWLALLVSFCIIAFRPLPACSRDALVISPEEQYAFAERYFARGQYYRAISEYERFLHFFSEDPRAARAMHRIGESYLKGRRYRQAVQAFQRFLSQYEVTDLIRKTYFGMAEAYKQLNQHEKAISTLETLKDLSEERDVKDAVFYRQGWLYLEMDDWKAAREVFDKISSQNRRKYRLEQLSEEMSKRPDVPTKNPSAAGFLAILPGAGHFYCGRPQDALMAFALNGAMIWAAYEAFDNDHDVLGGVITFFELGLYSGNIYSAVNCAHKFNRTKQRDFLQYLKEHSELGASLGRDVVLSYRLTF